MLWQCKTARAPHLMSVGGRVGLSFFRQHARKASQNLKKELSSYNSTCDPLLVTTKKDRQEKRGKEKETGPPGAGTLNILYHKM